MSNVERQVLFVSTLQAPQWFRDTPDLCWTKVADGSGSSFGGGATIAQVAPGAQPPGSSPQPNVFAYSGACVDQDRGEMLITGGGHTAYAGNEVYALRLWDAIPSWARLNDPSPGSYTGGGSAKNGPNQYTGDIGRNGAPIQGHTWNGICFANGRLWRPKIGGTHVSAGGPDGSARVFWFDRAECKWHAGQMWMSNEEASIFHSTYVEDSPAFFVPADNAIYTGPTNYNSGSVDAPNIVKIDADSGVVSRLWYGSETPGWNLEKFAATVLGPTSRLVAMRTYGSYRANGLYIFDVSTITSSPLGYCTVSDLTGGMSWLTWYANAVYHAASNALLISDGGSESFVKLAIPANPKTGTWVATKIDPANLANPSRTVPPVDAGCLGRFNMIEKMGDNRSALVFQPGNPTLPCYVMPLPAAGV